jgi:hypothetical protein
MGDSTNFMTWEEIAELHEMGFEIGNHSWSHLNFAMPAHAARLEGQLALVENELERVGVPRPVTFAWCGNTFGPEALEVLAARGYLLARRGMQPEVPYGRTTPGPLYDPKVHHPLLIPTAGDAYPEWTLDDFRRVVDRATAGKAVVVQFHGVPDVVHPWVNMEPGLFRECMDYLKSNGFHVVALRDLLPHVDPAAEVPDAMTSVRFGPKHIYLPAEVQASRVHADFWIPNMLHAHGYTQEEAAAVLAWPVTLVEAHPAVLAPWVRDSHLAPYPGGRHPRTGFLDGAIDPLRGAKATIFSPWDDGGYALIDLPEAVFSNLGLIFLAHTHVPTVWDAQHLQIDNRDWVMGEDGAMENLWTLPNGVRIGAEARPADLGADFTLWLENGTTETLTGLRTQVCVMLKGLPGFGAQSEDNKTYTATAATALSDDGQRTVTVEFSHCVRAWGNPEVPCIHADPFFPDCAPGERTEVKGRLRFDEQ